MTETIDSGIQLAYPVIGDRERELVEQVLSSGILALGPLPQFPAADQAPPGRRGSPGAERGHDHCVRGRADPSVQPKV